MLFTKNKQSLAVYQGTSSEEIATNANRTEAAIPKPGGISYSKALSAGLRTPEPEAADDAGLVKEMTKKEVRNLLSPTKKESKGQGAAPAQNGSKAYSEIDLFGLDGDDEAIPWVAMDEDIDDFLPAPANLYYFNPQTSHDSDDEVGPEIDEDNDDNMGYMGRDYAGDLDAADETFMMQGRVNSDDWNGIKGTREDYYDDDEWANDSDSLSDDDDEDRASRTRRRR